MTSLEREGRTLGSTRSIVFRRGEEMDIQVLGEISLTIPAWQLALFRGVTRFLPVGSSALWRLCKPARLVRPPLFYALAELPISKAT
jgi:hypothetical protein